MSKAFVHIGFNKCGSTAIQKWLSMSAGELRKQGFAYRRTDPRSRVVCSNPQFAELAYTLAGQVARKREMTRVIGFKHGDLEDQKRVLLGFADQYMRWVVKHELPNTLISNEFLAPWLNRPELVRALDNWLGSVFDEVRYLVYLREPVSWQVSRFGQRTKRGETNATQIDRFVETAAKIPFANRLETWLKAVPRDRLDVRLYNEDWGKNAGLIPDYCDAIGFDHGQLSAVDVRANTSFKGSGFDPAASLRRLVRFQKPLERPRPDAQLIDKILTSCETGFDWIEDTFFQDRREEFRAWRLASLNKHT